MKDPARGTTPGGSQTLTGERPRAAVATPPAAARAARPPDASGRRRRRSAWATIVLFLLPALALFVLLVLIPIAIAAYASLYNWNGLGPLTRFVGLDNFTRMFTDPVFLGDLWRGLVLIVLSLTVQLPMALGLALLLNQRLPGMALFRLLFFVPYILSEATTAVLFRMVFSPQQGLANQILEWAGLDHLETTWFGDPNTVLYWVFLVITWKYFGFHMILYLAGRQNIPAELTDAAATDGAGPWQTFRHVTLPLLGPTIRISVFLSVIGALQLFDMVWVLTQGGPTHHSEVMAVTMFHHGFERYEVGYASAISFVMFLLSLIFALGYQRWVMRRDVEGAVTRLREQA